LKSVVEVRGAGPDDIEAQVGLVHELAAFEPAALFAHVATVAGVTAPR
jgi:hypothetical protein